MIATSEGPKRRGVTILVVVMIACVGLCGLLSGSLVATNSAVVVGFGAFDVGVGSMNANRVHYFGMPRITEGPPPGSTRHCVVRDPHNLILGPIGAGIVTCASWQPVAPPIGGPWPTVQPTP